MKTTSFQNHECAVIENDELELLVPRSIGPRILSLRFRGGSNLLAELPGVVTERPDGQIYHFHGGHRLWLAPEDPMLSYGLDDQPVEVTQTEERTLIRKPVEAETGFEKSMTVTLDPGRPGLTITHRLTNLGKEARQCAPWTITQMRTGGIAVLPQANAPTGLLPNRLLTLWPYTDLSSENLTPGRDFLLLRAQMKTPFKVGFPNPRGWLACWLDGVLFVKRAAFDAAGRYVDFGCSSECYCNDRFLELETLGPLVSVAPGGTVTHTERWDLYADIPAPLDEKTARAIADQIGLD